MAPEQIEGRWNDLDQRSDLYSLGVITYQMFFSKLPIKFSSKDSIVQVLEKKKELQNQKFDPKILEELCDSHGSRSRKRPAHIEEVMDFLKKYHKFGGAKKTFKNWLNECLDEAKQEAKLKRQKTKKKATHKEVQQAGKVKKPDFLETVMIYTLIVLVCGVLGVLLKLWLQG